jgi:hypothetical protein
MAGTRKRSRLQGVVRNADRAPKNRSRKGRIEVSISGRVMTAILEKVRSVITPDHKPRAGGKIPPDHRNFNSDDPIAELRRIHSRYVEIESATDRLLSALKSVHEREREAYRVFNAACERDDAPAIDRALNE